MVFSQARWPVKLVRAIAIEEVVKHELVVTRLRLGRYAGLPHHCSVVRSLTTTTFPAEYGKVRSPYIVCVVMIGPGMFGTDFDIFNVIAV